MNKRNALLIVVLSILFVVSCGPQQISADLILTNGRIVTLDSQFLEVTAVAIQDNRILALGSSNQLARFEGPATRVIDLKGQLAIPGFIEGHGHFMGVGDKARSLDLTSTRSWSEVVDLVKEKISSTPPGVWVVGRGWHQEKWEDIPEPNLEGLPIHFSLSEASPENPVLLTHASGHALFANAKAMEIAGIDASTKTPEGGEILCDASGRPIGIFRETAQRALRQAYEKSRAKRNAGEVKRETRQTAQLAAQECISKGITSFHDAGASFETIDLYKELADEGELGVRIYAMLNEPNARLEKYARAYRIVDYEGHFLTVRAIKRLIDGALGVHGAWLLEPYSDLPTSSGLNTLSIDSLRETARIAREEGLQLCVHAIGDRANREVLDLYEDYLGQSPSADDLRWRIEHAQHINERDIPRFAELNVIASMQAIHATSDGPWVETRLGHERAAEGAYVWRSLLDSGAIISNGTDAPVEDVDPIRNFYAAVTRITANGTTFFPDQKMSRKEALRSMTEACAYAAFQEEILGTLSPGKLADITVLSRDILTIAEDEILEAKVTYTIVDGQLVYSANE